VLDLLVGGQRREETGKRRLELRFRVGLAARREEEGGPVRVALDAAEEARPVVEEAQPCAIVGEVACSRRRDEVGEVGAVAGTRIVRGESRDREQEVDQGRRREATCGRPPLRAQRAPLV